MLARLPATVVAALERGGTIVTADPHQAYQIRLAWAERQTAAGLTSWSSPDVLHLSAAVARAWSRALIDGDVDLPALLGVHQERAIWEQIVRGGGERFLQPHGTARAALRAWRRLRDWDIDVAGLWASAGEEAATFYEWALSFQERCRARHWVDNASAITRMPPPAGAPAWIFTGFDAPSVSVRALAERLRAAGTETQFCAGPELSSKVSSAAFADAQGEWRAAAIWARARLSTNPQQRLLIVIPDLERARERIERTFDEILRPQALAGAPGAPATFAIEGGVQLARYPMVATALTAVAMAADAQPFNVASAWFRSLYLDGAGQRAADRARLDGELRSSAAHELDLGAFAAALARAARRLGIEDRLIDSLNGFQRALEGRHGMAQWSARLSEALRQIGWPGPAERDSAEQQTLEKFNDTLAELAMLDDIVGPVDARGMLQHLRVLAEQTRFQPETGAAPVSLSGRLADPALGLDGLWVCGLHAEAWPRAPRPDPFLPWELQAQAGIPEATAAGMLRLARHVTQRWAASATEVIFSRPLRIDDEECLSSPLLADYPAMAGMAALAGADTPYWRTIRESARREELPDSQGPALPPGAAIPGGAYALTLQSQCPIRAFADRRLRAGPLRQPEPGIDARTRGIFVHESLANLWAQIGDSPPAIGTREQLAALGASQRAAIVASAVAKASKSCLERSPRWPTQLLELERARMTALLEEWIAIELRRPAFAVLAHEPQVTVTVGGFAAELRIDRVDRLDDGRLLIIDYKTGAQTPAASLGERPESAQLPLYAIAYRPVAEGAAIAQLRPGDCSLKGESSWPAMTSGIGAVDWKERLADWQRTVERLVGEFASGDARVDPRTPVTCDTCHLHSFCRIDELRAGPVIDLEVADGD